MAAVRELVGSTGGRPSSSMKKQLWLRLKHYHFEDLVPSQLRDHVRAVFGGTNAPTEAFASKLSRKLGWTRQFSLRSIEEYRKFVYLGVVSDASVTPPKVIDQVWHEHLLFSRAYREFCRDVLERDFDHNPELVPSDEQTEAFHTQYAATLDLYRDEFNMTPPEDMWGTPKFATDDSPIEMPKPDRKKSNDGGATSPGDDLPLYLFFNGDGADGGVSHAAMSEFGGGGGFSGGGSGSSWGNGADSNQGADAGAGSDSGGGSGCSSSCGGD